MRNDLAIFDGHQIRRLYDEKTETWFFSVIDIVQVLTIQPDYQTARKYWNKLKERLKKEENQSVTKCHRLKLEANDGKKYLTDVANAETLLRLGTCKRCIRNYYGFFCTLIWQSFTQKPKIIRRYEAGSR